MGKRDYTHHVYHHKDQGDKRTWAWLEFGIPLIVYAVVIFGLMSVVGLPLSNGLVFIVGAVISIALAVITSRKLSKLFDKMSDYLNGR